MTTDLLRGWRERQDARMDALRQLSELERLTERGFGLAGESFDPWAAVRRLEWEVAAMEAEARLLENDLVEAVARLGSDDSAELRGLVEVLETEDQELSHHVVALASLARAAEATARELEGTPEPRSRDDDERTRARHVVEMRALAGRGALEIERSVDALTLRLRALDEDWRLRKEARDEVDRAR